MTTIFKCEFGSIIYGTNMPNSDKDYKSIHIPTAKEILLQRVKKNISNNTKLDKHSKNTKEDIDDQSVSYQEYLRLLLEGQIPMLDMLFCPGKHWLESSMSWLEIVENKQYFLHKGTSAFVGYTKQQAAKYGIKGSRVNALKTALDLINTFDPNKTLTSYERELEDLITATKDFLSVEKKPLIFWEYLDVKGTIIKHISINNRKFALNSRIKFTKQALQHIHDIYGHRAQQAAANIGIDWKALYHAVRVANQSIELLLTSQITFPRPEAQLLLQIRKGEIPYNQVAEIIEQGLTEVEEAKNKSYLPEKPNFEKADELVYNLYKDIIIKG